MQIMNASGKKDIIQESKALPVLGEKYQDKDNKAAKGAENKNGVTVDFSEQALEMLQKQIEANREARKRRRKQRQIRQKSWRLPDELQEEIRCR